MTNFKHALRRVCSVGMLAAIIAGCVTGERVSVDSDYNYAQVFPTMRQPKPVVLNSRLDRYAKSAGVWTSREWNGEWEFEIIAPRAWVDEVKTNFEPGKFSDVFRRPAVRWWKPTEESFEAYRMQHTSYPAAHLYVEKHPKDESRIHVFIQRH
jgi:hypothetical protein